MPHPDLKTLTRLWSEAQDRKYKAQVRVFRLREALQKAETRYRKAQNGVAEAWEACLDWQEPKEPIT